MTYTTQLADTVDLESMLDLAELEACERHDDAERYRKTAEQLREILERRGSRGYTLGEAALVVTILSVIVGVAYTVVHFVLKFW